MDELGEGTELDDAIDATYRDLVCGTEDSSPYASVDKNGK
jgi:hypothetical protein